MFIEVRKISPIDECVLINSDCIFEISVGFSLLYPGYHDVKLFESNEEYIMHDMFYKKLRYEK